MDKRLHARTRDSITGSIFESNGAYIQQKRGKLQEQFGSAIPASGDLFSNCVFWIDGLAVLEQLKSLIYKNGGKVIMVNDYTIVTHLVADHLPLAKVQELLKIKLKRPHVVPPKWIFESISQGRRLREIDFALPEMRPAQRNLMSFGVQLQEDEKGSLSPVSSKPSQFHTPAKGKEITSDPQDFASPSHESPQARRSPPGAGFGSEPSYQPPPIEQPGPGSTIREYHSHSRLHHLGTAKQHIRDQLRALSRIPQVDLRELVSRTLSEELGREIPADGIRATKPLVFHVDMDCFFASVSTADQPELRGRPIVVAHGTGARPVSKPGAGVVSGAEEPGAGFSSTSSISCANYAARAFGIRADQSVGSALRACPELLVLPYEMPRYLRASELLYRVLFRFSHRVQIHSIDEAMLLVDVPYPSSVSGEALGEDPSSASLTEEELVRRSALAVAESIRREVFALTRCSASVGVAPSLFLARLSTRRAKPDGSFAVPRAMEPREFLELFGGMSCWSCLPGLGWKSRRKAEEVFGDEEVESILDFSRLPLSRLVQLFGPGRGRRLHEACRGRDTTALKIARLGDGNSPFDFASDPQDEEDGDDSSVESVGRAGIVRKSVGAQVTWGVRHRTQAQVRAFFGSLCAEVAERLARVGARPRRFSVTVLRRQAGAPLEPPHKYLGHGLCDRFVRHLSLGAPLEVPFRPPRPGAEEAGVDGDREQRAAAERILGCCWPLYEAIGCPPEELRGLGIQASQLSRPGAPGAGSRLVSLFQRAAREQLQDGSREDPEESTRENGVQEGFQQSEILRSPRSPSQRSQRSGARASPAGSQKSLSQFRNTEIGEFEDDGVLTEPEEEEEPEENEAAPEVRRAVPPPVLGDSLPNFSQLDRAVVLELPPSIRRELALAYRQRAFLSEAVAPAPEVRPQAVEVEKEEPRPVKTIHAVDLNVSRKRKKQEASAAQVSSAADLLNGVELPALSQLDPGMLALLPKSVRAELRNAYLEQQLRKRQAASDRRKPVVKKELVDEVRSEVGTSANSSEKGTTVPPRPRTVPSVSEPPEFSLPELEDPETLLPWFREWLRVCLVFPGNLQGNLPQQLPRRARFLRQILPAVLLASERGRALIAAQALLRALRRHCEAHAAGRELFNAVLRSVQEAARERFGANARLACYPL